MNRRSFLARCSLGALSTCFSARTSKSAEKRNDRPNIVVILADDMGYSDLGCYGGEIDTPHLNALAADGVRFTQFYNAGRCCPTRASLLTGIYPHQADVGNMVYRDQGTGYHGYLNKRCVTLAEVLRRAGYHTMMSGKWHVGHHNGVYPSQRGFDRFYGIHKHVDSYFKVLPGCPVFMNGKQVLTPTDSPKNKLHPDREWHTTEVFTDYALRFLDETKKKNDPFFLYLAYNSPHWPLEAPDKEIEKYRGRYTSGWEEVRKKRFERMKKMGLVQDNRKLSPPESPQWETLSDDDRQNLDFRRAIYAAQIDVMDQNIGRVVRKLKELGVLDNTLILFLSDNGCSAEPEQKMFGYRFKENRLKNFSSWRTQSGRSSSQGLAWANASNTPFRKYKKWAHEGGIATPLIAHWPNVITQKGTLCHQPGHIIDVMATCVAAAKAAYPKTYDGNRIQPMEGTSLLPAFKGEPLHRKPPLFWEHIGNWAVRDGDWKLVCDGPAGPLELYNLKEDRTELHNLIRKYPGKAAALVKRWEEWAGRAHVLPWPYKPPWSASFPKNESGR